MEQHLDALIGGLFAILVGICGFAIVRILAAYDHHIENLWGESNKLRERVHRIEGWKSIVSAKLRIKADEDND